MTVDLSTSYLGLELKNPLVVGACPLTGQLDKLLRMEQAGAAAFVLPSLFEEQIQQDDRSLHTNKIASASDAQSLAYFPGIDDFTTTPDAYLRVIEEAKKSVTVPVIGSLNGVTLGGWTRFASLIENAGADALELNMYALETDPAVRGQEVEARYLELVRAIRQETSIPLAVKLGPYFTAFANFAAELSEAGADGLVMFNRFFQPDIDVDLFEVQPSLRLSDPAEIRLPLRWIAMLHGRLDVSLAATTGIHSAQELIKYILVGADVGMIASAVIRKGPDVISSILAEFTNWLREHDYKSVDDARGLLDQSNCQDSAAFERANYMRTLLQNFSKEAGDG